MDKKKNYKVVMTKDQLVQFLGVLHDKQLDMIDLAVDKSDLKEAKAVIDKVMAL